MPKHQPTPEHLAALSRGRNEGAAIRNYLSALQSQSKKKRGRQPKSADAIQAEIETESDPVKRLKLRANLREVMLREALNSPIDMEELEKNFITYAKSYSDRNGLTYADWRLEGVEPAVLKAAGITRGAA